MTRIVFLSVGLLVVLVGLASALAYISRATFGSSTGLVAFAPATLLFNTAPTVVHTALLVFDTMATTTPIVPLTLRIPSLGVVAHVQVVGKRTDGRVATPTNFSDVGWYSLGSHPGDAGTAIFAGHVNNALTKGGVFEHLSQIAIGDSIAVANALGRTLTYRVTETHSYPADNAPLSSIFTGSGPSRVILVTCDGDWEAQTHSFTRRFVVFADLTTVQ